jgi:dihydroflavonol-4-reductase
MVFGEGDLHRNAGRLLLQLAAGRLKWVPSGCTTAAVLEDVVAGHLSALDRGQAGNSWVLGGSTLSFLELTTRIAAVLKVAPPKGVLPDWVLFGAALASEGLGWWTQKEPVLTRALAEFSVRNRKYSSEKAEKELGYRPQLLEVGIERCWRWYQQQGWL